jgi:hypothetical protein
MQFDEGVLDDACGDAVEFGDLSQVERIHELLARSGLIVVVPFFPPL